MDPTQATGNIGQCVILFPLTEESKASQSIHHTTPTESPRPADPSSRVQALAQPCLAAAGKPPSANPSFNPKRFCSCPPKK